MKPRDRYLKLVSWSEEDHCYVGSVPGWVGPCCHGNEKRRFTGNCAAFSTSGSGSIGGTGGLFPADRPGLLGTLRPSDPTPHAQGFGRPGPLRRREPQRVRRQIPEEGRRRRLERPQADEAGQDDRGTADDEPTARRGRSQRTHVVQGMRRMPRAAMK